MGAAALLLHQIEVSFGVLVVEDHGNRSTREQSVVGFLDEARLVPLKNDLCILARQGPRLRIDLLPLPPCQICRLRASGALTVTPRSEQLDQRMAHFGRLLSPCK
jgi:hypothetical protein